MYLFVLGSEQKPFGAKTLGIIHLVLSGYLVHLIFPTYCVGYILIRKKVYWFFQKAKTIMQSK